jgi:hypothetical protein
MRNVDSYARLTVGDIKQFVYTGRLYWEKYLLRTFGELPVEHLNRQANLYIDI